VRYTAYYYDYDKDNNILWCTWCRSFFKLKYNYALYLSPSYLRRLVDSDSVENLKNVSLLGRLLLLLRTRYWDAEILLLCRRTALKISSSARRVESLNRMAVMQLAPRVYRHRFLLDIIYMYIKCNVPILLGIKYIITLFIIDS